MTIEQFPQYISSEVTDKLIEAVLNVQTKVTTIGLDAENPFFKSKYATYHQIYQAIQPILVEQGLTVQFIMPGAAMLAIKVTHVESGQFEIINSNMIVEKKSPQGLFASSTYTKRYLLTLYFNLDVADIDDDGNTASGKETTAPQMTPESPKWKQLVVSVATDRLGIEKVQDRMNPVHFKLFKEQVEQFKQKKV